VDIGYARVSTDDQELKLQLVALERAGCWPIRKETASGVAKKRPVRDEVLKELQRGDTLTVWKLDRLGRSVVDLKTIITDLEQRGVKFRSLTEHIDTSTAQGRLFFDLLAAFAEFERQLIIERTRAAKAVMIAEGKHPGGRRRFGAVGTGENAISEEEAAREAMLLIEAAERLQGGENMSQVLNDWRDRGVTAYGGGTWEATVLRNMLTNRRVAEVIGAANYHAMTRLFANAAARRKIGRPAEHLLSGILKCECGQPMYATPSTKAIRNYRCRKAEWSGGRSRGCGRVNVSEPAADRAVTEMFTAAVCSEDFANALNQRQAELLAGDATAEQLDEWRQERDELALILPLSIAEDKHRARHAELERIVRDSTARLMERPDLRALLDLPKSEAKLRDAWSSWTVAERRAWLKRVLEYVTVHRATTTGRASDVAARLDPKWRI
jgi:DNA invertase Pin-like site-specific DNA recombinase